jgi:SHS2 domain-containing protein
MYEFFEHTADLGLRVQAPTLDVLFTEAARGLFAAIVDNPDAIAATTSRTVEIAGTDREYLLFDWLKELLYLSDAEQLLLTRFEVQVSDTGLKATVFGEPLDRDRHELGHEVKAITYHGLKVEQTTDGWLAEVIVDI